MEFPTPIAAKLQHGFQKPGKGRINTLKKRVASRQASKSALCDSLVLVLQTFLSGARAAIEGRILARFHACLSSKAARA